jgi:hypothetical protein
MTCARLRQWPGTPRRQRGATLLVGLIMLVLLTLHALHAYTVGTVQLRMAGNMQHRQDAEAAAGVALGTILGSAEFLVSPSTIAALPLDIDLDGDGADDYRVIVTPVCTAASPVPTRDLDAGLADDFACLAGTAFGGRSLCATTYWDLRARVEAAPGAPVTGAGTEIHQGAAIRVDAGEAGTRC